jgi:hypothetical protein
VLTKLNMTDGTGTLTFYLATYFESIVLNPFRKVRLTPTTKNAGGSPVKTLHELQHSISMLKKAQEAYLPWILQKQIYSVKA